MKKIRIEIDVPEDACGCGCCDYFDDFLGNCILFGEDLYYNEDCDVIEKCVECKFAEIKDR